MTSHLSQSNVTVHPTLHNGLMPIRDATVRWGTMCPVNMYGNPWMVMSHRCVNFIILPSGMLMLKGLPVQCLFTTLAPSIMNMDVAPVSAVAWVDAIVIGFRYSCKGWPNRECAVAAYEGCMHVSCSCSWEDWFDAATVTSSLSHVSAPSTNLVGFKKLSYAETKLLNLFATQYVFSAPPCQKASFGRTVLCIPLVQQL